MKGFNNVDHTQQPPTVLSLCSGYGGIEKGLERVFGEVSVLAHVEIESFAIANLVNKMETEQMVPAPVWTDLKTFRPTFFRGLVDILTGGYPCQPFSAAGKRKGEEDPRHLWPFIVNIIRDCQPRWCFFENVEGHLSCGIVQVLSDLEEMGYEVETGIFSAAEVGAPHQRKRVFILGYSQLNGLQGGCQKTEGEECKSQQRRMQEFKRGCDELANSKCVSKIGKKHQDRARGRVVLPSEGTGGQELADSELPCPSRLEQHCGEPEHQEETKGAVQPGGRAGEGLAHSMHKRCQCSRDEKRLEQEQTEMRSNEELARSSDKRHEGMQLSGNNERAHEEGPSCVSGAATECCFNGWPARPGEEQYGWEVPRVLAGSKIGRSRGRESGEHSGMEQQQSHPGEEEKGHEIRSETEGCNGESIYAQGDRAGDKISTHTQTKPQLGGTIDGTKDRVDRLRLLGNGVVPQTAEKAFRVLYDKIVFGEDVFK